MPAMSRENRNFILLGLLLLFTFQTFDVPPAKNHVNPKTCCGRTVCQCKHGPGVDCPFKKGIQKKSCPMQETAAPVEEKKPTAEGDALWTKAPCASDVPKTLLPNYSKNYILSVPVVHSHLVLQDFIAISSQHRLPLMRVKVLERPPRIF